MNGATKVDALVAVEDARARAAMVALLRDTEGFVVVGEAESGAEFSGLRSSTRPDLLVLDEALPGLGDVSTARAGDAGRPIPTLMLVRGPVQESPRERAESRRERISRISLELLWRDDAFSRSHVQTRLHLLVTKFLGHKRTQTSRSLADAVDALRGEAERVGILDHVNRLTCWPLTGLLYAGTVDAAGPLRHAFAKMNKPSVPVLVALEGLEVESAESARVALGIGPKVKVELLSSSAMLADLEGVVVLSTSRRAQFVDRMIELRKGEFNMTELIASVGTLGPTGLVILASGPEEWSAPLAQIANNNGLVAVVEPRLVENPTAARSALRWGLVERGLDEQELAWVMSKALAYRK